MVRARKGFSVLSALAAALVITVPAFAQTAPSGGSSAGLSRGQTVSGSLAGNAGGGPSYSLIGDGSLQTLNFTFTPQDPNLDQAVIAVVTSPVGGQTVLAVSPMQTNAVANTFVPAGATATVQIFDYAVGSNIQYTLTAQ